MELIIGERLAGNTSIEMRNMGVALLDTLLKTFETKNFQKFSSDDGNESLQSSPPSLTGFNIQASVTKIVTSDSWESPQ